MRPIGLYVHWPFCAQICPYCDFTVARQREVDAAAWQRALCSDLERLARMTRRRPLRSVYFGGGTPSLMPAEVAEAVLLKAEALFGIETGAEITLEANPDDRPRLALFRAVGVNRLSLGVQSFDDAELRFLGRNHDAKDAFSAVDDALALFGAVSLDLIYALPGQELADWERALAAALGLGAQHVSLYQLTIEPGTAFGRKTERGDLAPMPDDRAADLYEVTQYTAGQAGFPAYEVSNHARPGHQAVHNALYWVDADWLAIGPGAHGRLGPPDARLATVGARAPVGYPALGDGARIDIQPLSRTEHRLEVLAGGLRPVAGLDIDRLGGDADAVLAAAERFVECGLMWSEGRRIGASRRGRLLLDHLSAELAASVSGA